MSESTKRDELLKTDGIGRNVLEARIAKLVQVFDAATELVASDDHCEAMVHDLRPGDAENEQRCGQAEARYERAWEQLRATLNSL